MSLSIRLTTSINYHASIFCHFRSLTSTISHNFCKTLWNHYYPFHLDKKQKRFLQLAVRSFSLYLNIGTLAYLQSHIPDDLTNKNNINQEGTLLLKVTVFIKDHSLGSICKRIILRKRLDSQHCLFFFIFPSGSSSIIDCRNFCRGPSSRNRDYSQGVSYGGVKPL